MGFLNLSTMLPALAVLASVMAEFPQYAGSAVPYAGSGGGGAQFRGFDEEGIEEPSFKHKGKGGKNTNACDVCYKGKSRSLTFRYTATTGSLNTQGDKSYVNGQVSVGVAATISSSQYGFSQPNVQVGDTFVLTNGGSKFDAQTDIQIDGATIGLHTSCSVDLVIDDKFGPITLIGFIDEYGNTEAGTGCKPCYDDVSECPGPIAGQPCDACDSGRPISLTFAIDGGAPGGAYSMQQSKGGSIGDTLASPGEYTITGGSGASYTQPNGFNRFTVGQFQGVDTVITIADNESNTQTINFHTSCSKRLSTGDVFGAIRLFKFVDRNNVPSSNIMQCTGAPAPPCILCCQSPPSITQPAIDTIVNKEVCDASDDLQSTTYNRLEAWYNSQGGAVCVSNNIGGGGGLQWNASHTISEIEDSLCTDGDYCPDFEVIFTCCDPCDPTFPCQHTTAKFSIGFESNDEIDEFCIAPPGPITPCNVCTNKGKPRELVFTITGGAAGGPGSLQSGKGGSTGSTIASTGPYIVNCDGGVGTLFSANQFSVTNINTNELECTVSGGGGLQFIEIHTSCSKTLITGMQFGAIRVDSFIDSEGGTAETVCGSGGGGTGGYGNGPFPTAAPEVECYLCCVMLPEVEFPPDAVFPKIERCTADDKLPAGTLTLIEEWLETMSCESNNGAPHGVTYARVSGVRSNSQSTFCNDSLCFEDFTDLTAADIERLLCEDEVNDPDFPECPMIHVDFSCCDPCNADETPFDGLDPDALCLIGEADVSIIDNTNPVIVDAANKGVRCSTTPDLNDAQYRAWLALPMCTDNESPGVSWDIGSNQLSRITTATTDTCNQTVEVTYNCNDECLNAAVPKTVRFMTRDNVEPVVVNEPTELVLDCNIGDAAIENAITAWEATLGNATFDDCTDTTGVSRRLNTNNLCPRRMNVDFDVTDECGNTATVSSYVRLFDNTPPDISCPGTNCEEVVTCTDDAVAAKAAWINSNGGLLCEDACGGPITWNTPQMASNNDVANSCDKTETWTFSCTDSCGNEQTQDTDYKIEDPPPVITCVGDDCDQLTLCGEDAAGDLASWLQTFAGLSCTDNCGDPQWATPTLVSETGSIDTCNTAKVYEFTCSDQCDQRSVSVQQTFTVTDAPPTVTCTLAVDPSYVKSTDAGCNDVAVCAANAVAQEANWLQNKADLACADDCSAGFKEPVLLSTSSNSGCNVTRTYEFTCEDSCGNQDSSTQTFDIADSPPSISCPDSGPDCDEVVTCVAQAANRETAWLQDFGGLRCVDDCESQSDIIRTPTLVGQSTPILNSCNTTKTYEFTCEDSCGNTVSEERTFNVADAFPEVTCAHDSGSCDKDLPCADSYDAVQRAWLHARAGLACDDACGAVWNEPTFVSALEPSGCNTSRTYEFTCVDECGNEDSAQQTIEINDAPPVIDCSITDCDIALTCGDNKDNVKSHWLNHHANLICNDECGATWLEPVLVSDAPSSTCNTTQVYAFTCEDTCGNSVTQLQTFAVADPAPALECQSEDCDHTVTCGSHTAIAESYWLQNYAGLRCRDECETDRKAPELKNEIATSTCNVSKTYEFSCTDDCGNEDKVLQTFYVADAPPTITCSDNVFGCDKEVTCQDGFGYTEGSWLMGYAGLKCKDDCSSEMKAPVLLTTTPTTLGCNITKTYQFTCADDCGNEISDTQTISLLDAPPIVSCSIGNGCKDTTSIECNSDSDAHMQTWLANNGNLQCGDSCGIQQVSWEAPILISGPGDDTCNQLSRYRFTCMDSCGNKDVMELEFGVVDTEAPLIIDYPMSVSVECDGSGNTVELDGFLAMYGSQTGTRWANDECHPNPVCGNYRTAFVAKVGHCPYCSNTYDSEVCANGVTYPSPCYAMCYGEHVYTDGPCDAPTTVATTTEADATTTRDLCSYCTNNYNPVCVGGDLQFPNYCFAYCAEQYQYVPGPCDYAPATTPGGGGAGYVTTTTSPPSCNDYCGEYMSFVCGSDGVTYNSPCHASCAGITTHYPGKCNSECNENPLEYYFLAVSEGTGDCPRKSFTFSARDPCLHEVTTPPVEFVIMDSTPPDMSVEAQDMTVECDGSGNTDELQAWLDNRGGAICQDICAFDRTTWQPTPTLGVFVENGAGQVCGSDCPYDRCKTVKWTCEDSCGLIRETTAKFVIVDTTPPDLTYTPVVVAECDMSVSGGANLAREWASNPFDVIIDSNDICNYCAIGNNPPPSSCDWPRQPRVVTDLVGYGTSTQEYWRQADGFYVVLPNTPVTGVFGVRPSEVDQSVLDIIKAENSAIDFGTNCPLISILDLTPVDACANEGESQMAYHVYTDTTPPEWSTVPEDRTVECERGTDANDVAFQDWLTQNAMAVCSDSCTLFGPSTSITYDTPFADSVGECPKETEVVFRCTDYCGNEITASAKFSVEDTMPPVIPPIPDKTIECGPNTDGRYQKWADLFVTHSQATDQCSRDAQLTTTLEVGALRKRPDTPATCSDEWGPTTVTVTDVCLNEADQTGRFYIRDSNPPEFTNEGVDFTYTCDIRCDNREEMASALFTKWANAERGCLEAIDCQEDMTWSTASGPVDLSSLCDTSGSIDIVVTDGCGLTSTKTLTYNFPLFQPPPPPPASQCEICSKQNKVGITTLTMQWTSNSGTGTTVSASDLSTQSIADGGTVIFDASNSRKGKFEANTDFTAGGTTVTVHTSCSQPIYVGLSANFPSGTLAVVGFRTSDGRTESTCPGLGNGGGNGGAGSLGTCDMDVDDIDVCTCIPTPAPPPPLEDVCDTGKPSQLTFEYIGGNQLTNSQFKNGEAKASVSGGVPSGTASQISCVGKSGSKGGGALQTVSNVAIGSTFDVGNGGSQLGTEMTCTVTAGGAVQVIEVHTSCSMPLNVGDIFGSLRLRCFKTSSGGTCQVAQTNNNGAGCPGPTPPPNPPPPGVCQACGDAVYSSSGSKSRPTVLTFRYIGGYALTNTQEGKAGVSPATAASGPAMITCNSFGLSFQVNIDGEFTIGSAGYELGTETECTIRSNSGTQVVDVHTSCSKDLIIGDIFGSIVLISFSKSDGTFGSTSPGCPTTTSTGSSTSNQGGGSTSIGNTNNNGGGVVIGGGYNNNNNNNGGGIVIGGGDGGGDNDNDNNGGGSADCTYTSICDARKASKGQVLKSLTLQLNYSNAAIFQHSQGSFGIQQVYKGPTNGNVRVRIGGVLKNKWVLDDGAVFRLSAQAYGVNKIPNQLSFLVIGAGKKKARIKFQANCKRELAVGDVFGLLTVVGFSTTSEQCETKSVSDALTDEASSSSGNAAPVAGAAVAGVIVGVMLIVAIVAGVYKMTSKSNANDIAHKITLSSTKEQASTHDLAWDEQQAKENAEAGN